MTQAASAAAPSRASVGVLIQQLRRASIAWAAGLRPGMIVTAVMGEPVRSPAELAVALARHDMRRGVSVTAFDRSAQRTYLLKA